MRLTLNDWSATDERRFQRIKRKLRLQAIRENEYVFNPYRDTDLLRSDTVSGIGYREESQPVLNYDAA